MHDRLRSLLRRLAVAVGGDVSAAEGARILRVPGTKNQKYTPPRPVTIELIRPRRVYELAEIEKALPAGQSSTVQAAPFKVPETIPYHTRNNTLYGLARSLHAKDLSHDAILAALREENAAKGRPPLEDEELQKIAANAFTQPDRPDFRLQAGDAPAGHPAPGRVDGTLILVNLADVEPEEIDWLWRGRIARGKVTIIMGDPGLGKSTLALDIAARVTTRAKWPDAGRARRGSVVILTAEDGLADTVRPRIDVLEGNAARITVLQAVQERGQERAFNLARDLRALEQAIFNTQACLVIIDPLSAYLGKVDSFKDTEVRSVLSPLAALAEKTHVAILAVMHLAKDTKRAALYRAQGSIGFVAAARSVLAVAKDPEQEDRRLLVSVKSNISAPPPALAFSLSDRGLHWERIPVDDIDVETLLRGGGNPEEKAQRQDAVTFLRDLLADRELPAKEVFKAAKENGIAERTLKRAKVTAGVKSRKRGVGSDGVWYWYPPKTPTGGRGPGRD